MVDQAGRDCLGVSFFPEEGERTRVSTRKFADCSLKVSNRAKQERATPRGEAPSPR